MGVLDPARRKHQMALIEADEASQRCGRWGDGAEWDRGRAGPIEDQERGSGIDRSARNGDRSEPGRSRRQLRVKRRAWQIMTRTEETRASTGRGFDGGGGY
jgi:hypothetical protein